MLVGFDDMKLKFTLAEAYSWDREYSASIDLFKEIILKTDSPWAKEKLAEVYIWNGQPEKARTVLAPLVKASPDNETLKKLWGKALYYTGDSEKASRVFEDLLQEGR